MSETTSASGTTGRSQAKSKADRAEANRRNAQKSTGPTSVEGKARSRFNALKHGMTARAALLPGENADEFTDRLRELYKDLSPRNRLEALLVERIARDDWMSLRAERAAAAQLAFRLRHDEIEQTHQERDEVVKLGLLLLRHLEPPPPVSASDGEGARQDPPSDASSDPYHPAWLRLRLEGTTTGCDWLLERWARLEGRLDAPKRWTRLDGYEMIRLMGSHAIDVATNYEVQFVLQASTCIAEMGEVEVQDAAKVELAKAEAEVKVQEELSRATFKTKSDEELESDEAGREFLEWGMRLYRIEELRKQTTSPHDPFAEEFKQTPLGRLTPPSLEEARERLLRVMAKQVIRIERIGVEHERIATADAADAPARLAFQTGPEGDRQRRYVLSRDRLLNRTIDTFLKVRKSSEDGALESVDDSYELPVPACQAVEGDAVAEADVDESPERGAGKEAGGDGDGILPNEPTMSGIDHGNLKDHGEAGAEGIMLGDDRCLLTTPHCRPPDGSSTRNAVQEAICDGEGILPNEPTTLITHHDSEDHDENGGGDERGPPG